MSNVGPRPGRMTTMETEFSGDSAHVMATELRAAGITDVCVMVVDYATPENTVGQRYSVKAVIRDSRHGNTIVRTLRGPAVAADVAKEMQREVKSRAKETRARMRVWNEIDAE